MQALAQYSAFLLIPQLSALLVRQLGFPRAALSSLYLAGGLCALLLVQISARVLDRHGLRLPLALSALLYCIGCGLLLLPAHSPQWLVALLFVCFMAGNAARNITLASWCSHAPPESLRGRYLALQGVVQDAAIACAAMLGAAALGL